jgi:hypothetical protein
MEPRRLYSAGGTGVAHAVGASPAVTPQARAAEVYRRHVFYNHSMFDGGDAAANALDDQAIDPEKNPQLPAQGWGHHNVTSYTRGLNGVMIDMVGMPPSTEPAASDFQFAVRPGGAGGWSDAPPPVSVTRRTGAGVANSDRITLVWADGAIRNAWLRVTLLVGARTGMVNPDVFCFANLIGETDPYPIDLSVDARYVVRTRAATTSAAGIDSRFDHNRDGRVNVLDAAEARANLGRSIDMLYLETERQAPPTSAFATTRYRPPLRRPASPLETAAGPLPS